MPCKKDFPLKLYLLMPKAPKVPIKVEAKADKKAIKKLFLKAAQIALE